MSKVSYGIMTFNGLCSSVGDTLGLSAVLKQLNEKKNEKIVICTIPAFTGLFANNPYIEKIEHHVPTVQLQPCRKVPCKIVNYYAEQLNLEIIEPLIPQIYLTADEIEYGKSLVKEFDGYKKIVISTETLADSKNLRPEYITPIFNKLKQDGYKLIGVGNTFKQKIYNYDKSFIDKTTIREVASIIGACDLFVGIDNGLFHIAAAVNVPQVIFFRNNLSSNNAYYNTHFIDSNVKCQGDCLKHLPKCVALVRCMDSFDLNKYYDLIINTLNK